MGDGVASRIDDFSRGWRISSVRAEIAVRALTALPEDLGAVLSTYISSQPSVIQLQGIQHPCLASLDTCIHVVYIHRYIQIHRYMYAYTQI